MSRVYNFSAGPAMLPTPVMEQVQKEFLNYQNMGASVIEISHRSKQFEAIVNQADALLRELTNLPENYKILYVHGGARMQFSAIPLNLMGRKPARKALYFETGDFAKLANQEAVRYGTVEIVASSADTKYDRIPDVTESMITADASYVHITSNNTIYGTRWNTFPKTGDVPLVSDATSEILSRQMDYSQFGVVYAGLQKNLGPSGLAVVLIREDLLGHADPTTPTLLDYAVYEKNHSLTNTTNTFAIYMLQLVLEWLKAQGGVPAIEVLNQKKANLLYEIVDHSEFYTPSAQPDHRSIMNVTFNLPNDELLDLFLKDALKEGLYALKGHRNVGGIRASIYNAMPLEGVETLASFMKEFERTKG